MRPLDVAFPVAVFPRSQFQTPKMLTKSIAHQSGTVSLHPADNPVGRVEEFLVKNNLDRFHMLSLFHSIFHSQIRPVPGKGLNSYSCPPESR